MKTSILCITLITTLPLSIGYGKTELSPEQRVAPKEGYYKMIVHNETPYTLSINVSIARWAPEYLKAKRDGITFYGVPLDFEGIINAFPKIEPGESEVYEVRNKKGIRIGSEGSELEITALDKEGNKMVSVFKLRDIKDSGSPAKYVIKNEVRYRDKLRKLPEIEGIDLEVTLPTGYTEKIGDSSELENIAAELRVKMEEN